MGSVVAGVAGIGRSAAEDLGERLLVERDAEIVFEPRDIGADDIVGIGVLQRGCDRLACDRIERGIHDVGHAEYETRGYLIALGAGRHAFDRLEGRIDQLRRREAARLAALQVGCRYPVSYTHLTLPTNREV